MGRYCPCLEHCTIALDPKRHDVTPDRPLEDWIHNGASVLCLQTRCGRDPSLAPVFVGSQPYPWFLCSAFAAPKGLLAGGRVYVLPTGTLFTAVPRRRGPNDLNRAYALLTGSCRISATAQPLLLDKGTAVGRLQLVPQIQFNCSKFFKLKCWK